MGRHSVSYIKKMQPIKAGTQKVVYSMTVSYIKKMQPIKAGFLNRKDQT